jgi:hypothetical protein
MEIPNIREMFARKYIVLSIAFSVTDRNIVNFLIDKGYDRLLMYSSTINMRKKYTAPYFNKLVILHGNIFDYFIDGNITIEFIDVSIMNLALYDELDEAYIIMYGHL